MKLKLSRPSALAEAVKGSCRAGGQPPRAPHAKLDITLVSVDETTDKTAQSIRWTTAVRGEPPLAPSVHATLSEGRLQRPSAGHSQRRGGGRIWRSKHWAASERRGGSRRTGELGRRCFKHEVVMADAEVDWGREGN